MQKLELLAKKKLELLTKAKVQEYSTQSEKHNIAVIGLPQVTKNEHTPPGCDDGVGTK